MAVDKPPIAADDTVSGPQADDCRVAVLTPPGRGAVASIVVEGRQARRQVARQFTPAINRSLESIPSGRLLLGRWQLPLGLSGSTPGEEVVVVCRDPASVEIHCHGGTAAAAAIVSSLVAQGVRASTASHWLVSQQQDRLVADAHLALAHARTTRVAAILLDQYRGALSQAVTRIRQLLADGADQLAANQLYDLLRWAALGMHLIQPWQVVLIGPTNAGKSSLINALLGYRRAIVFHEAGTTRDVLTDVTAIDGWPIELADTAGWRITDSDLESEGMRRAQQRALGADLLLIVTDVTRPWGPDELRQVTEHGCGDGARTCLLVHNKADLREAIPDDRPAGILTSAIDGTGIDHVLHSMVQRLVPQVPSPGTAVPFLARHRQALSAALAAARARDCQGAQQHLHRLQAPDTTEPTV